MPKVHDERRAQAVGAEAAKDPEPVGKKQALKGLSYEEALTALAPVTDKAYQGLVGLEAFTGVSGLLDQIRGEAIAVKRAGTGMSSAAGDFASLLNALKSKVNEISASAEYFQCGDLATRKLMKQEEKQRVAEKAAKDVEALTRVIAAIESLVSYVVDTSAAKDSLDDTISALGTELGDMRYMWRTFRGEAFQTDRGRLAEPELDAAPPPDKVAR